MQPTTAVVGGDRDLRVRAIERARGPSRLKAVELSPAALAVTQRYIDGEIDSDGLIEEMAKLPSA